MTTKKIRLSDLVCDFDMYPRASVDSVHVRAIRDAIEAGEQVPPIITDEESKRVVDGFHRYRAWRRVLGSDGEVEVEIRSYDSEADLFADAVRLNARHGRPFAPYDRARSIARAVELGMTTEKIAECIGLRVDRVKEITMERTSTAPNGSKVVIKNTLRHLRGKRLTKAQQQANGRAGGMAPLFYVNQVTNLVENGAMDLENEAVVVALGQLRDMLDSLVELQVPVGT